jgi:hypothetical protein
MATSITLTSFVIKTLKILVVRFPKTGPLVKHPLAASQYAYREGWSNETVLNHLLGRVERQLEAKEHANWAFLDTEGTFNSISKVTIKQAMIRHEISEVLMDWAEHMLAGRNLTVYYRKKTYTRQEAVHREGFYPHYCDAS